MTDRNPFKFCEGQGCFACDAPLSLDKPPLPPSPQHYMPHDGFWYYGFCNESCARLFVSHRRDLEMETLASVWRLAPEQPEQPEHPNE